MPELQIIKVLDQEKLIVTLGILEDFKFFLSQTKCRRSPGFFA